MTRQTQLDSRGLKIHPGISVSLLCLGQNKNTPRWNPVNLKFAQSDGCQSGSQLKKNVVWGIKIVVCLDQNLCEDKKGKRGSEMGQLACIKAPSGPYSSYWLTLSEVLMGPYWWITHQPILLINNTCAHRRSPSLHTHTHTQSSVSLLQHRLFLQLLPLCPFLHWAGASSPTSHVWQKWTSEKLDIPGCKSSRKLSFLILSYHPSSTSMFLSDIYQTLLCLHSAYITHL